MNNSTGYEGCEAQQGQGNLSKHAQNRGGIEECSLQDALRLPVDDGADIIITTFGELYNEVGYLYSKLCGAASPLAPRPFQRKIRLEVEYQIRRLVWPKSGNGIHSATDLFE
jgi:hypothetical protein